MPEGGHHSADRPCTWPSRRIRQPRTSPSPRRARTPSEWAGRRRSRRSAGWCCGSSRPPLARRRSSRSAPAAVLPASGCSAACARDGPDQRGHRARAPAAGQGRVPAGRIRALAGTRLITGRALEVLPRLADGAYDLVFCDADKREYRRVPGGRPPAAAAGRHRRIRQRALGRRGRPIPRTGTRRPGPSARCASWSFEDEGLVPLLLPAGDGCWRRSSATPSGWQACSELAGSPSEVSAASEQQPDPVTGGARGELAVVRAAAAAAGDVQVRPGPLAGELAQEQGRRDGTRPWRSGAARWSGRPPASRARGR